MILTLNDMRKNPKQVFHRLRLAAVRVESLQDGVQGLLGLQGQVEVPDVAHDLVDTRWRHHPGMEDICFASWWILKLNKWSQIVTTCDSQWTRATYEVLNNGDRMKFDVHSAQAALAAPREYVDSSEKLDLFRTLKNNCALEQPILIQLAHPLFKKASVCGSPIL